MSCGIYSYQSSSVTNWLSLFETTEGNIFVTASTLATIIQGHDVLVRQWTDHKKKSQHYEFQTGLLSSVSSTQQSPNSSQKTLDLDTEIIDTFLEMDEGSHNTFKRWISNSDALRAYTDAFSNSIRNINSYQVIIRKAQRQSAHSRCDRRKEKLPTAQRDSELD